MTMGRNRRRRRMASLGNRPDSCNVRAMFIAIFAPVFSVVAGALAGGSIFLSKGIRALRSHQALKGLTFTSIGAIFTVPSGLWLLAFLWTALAYLFRARTH